MLRNPQDLRFMHNTREPHGLPQSERRRQPRRPNGHARKLTDLEKRISIARRWIRETIKNFFNGALWARSEGDAIDTLDKKVRPGNTRLGRGKERRMVLVSAFKSLVKDGILMHVEDRAIYGLTA